MQKSAEIHTERFYTVRTKTGEAHSIPVSEIFMIRNTPQENVLELHGKRGLLKFRGMISRIAADVPEFFRSHVSVVVNIHHIRDVCEKSRKLKLANGLTIPIAKSKIPLLWRECQHKQIEIRKV